MKIRVPDLYRPLVEYSISEIVEPSGRCSAKSTSNEIYAVSLMLKNQKNNIWYCRAEKGDIRSTVFSSMISTIQLMGVERFFSWSLSPYQITCLTTGAICYFDGINGKTDDDVTATKGFSPQYNSLAVCILDEADQVKHPNHITAWESTAVRFFQAHSKIIYAYNPPMSRSHWAHKFFGDKIKNGATKIYATWEDVRTLLNEKTIQTIEKFRRDDPEYYRYWYLGESVLFHGNDNNNEEWITPLKLQKMLFFAQAIVLVQCNKALFREPILHWDLGPVVKEVYDEYKKNQRSPIKSAPKEKIDSTTVDILKKVYKIYGRYSAAYLVELTHREIAWRETKKDEVLPLTLIRNTFSGTN